ncbi:phage tail assembly chaperone [Lelliottia amnigena]|uniref:phage tail assembly chaperone n=1 Tax=Lelliottia amnigena TaxID=61646 RepID=UPI004056F630
MEFEIKGEKYRVAKLDVFQQLKVSRKLLPILAGLMADIGSIKTLLPAGGKIENEQFDALAPLLEKVLPRIAEELSALSDEDTDAIIHPCLAKVSRQHLKSWVPVFNQGSLAFDDIDLFVMLQLVARVVADSLGNFLPATPTSETTGQPQA